jgi:hypothetical protein
MNRDGSHLGPKNREVLQAHQSYNVFHEVRLHIRNLWRYASGMRGSNSRYPEHHLGPAIRFKITEHSQPRLAFRGIPAKTCVREAGRNFGHIVIDWLSNI